MISQLGTSLATLAWYEPQRTSVVALYQVTLVCGPRTLIETVEGLNPRPVGVQL